MSENPMDHDFYQKKVEQHLLPHEMDEPAIHHVGKWFMRVYLALNLLRCVLSILLYRSHFFLTVMDGFFHVLLYRGVLWFRIIMVVDAVFKFAVYGRVYTALVTQFGFGTGVMMLPFMLYFLITPFFLFFFPPVKEFLKNQRWKYFGQ